MMPVWLLALTIAGKLTALGKDVVFAGAFGAGPSADAYFVANQLPGIIWLAVYGTIVSVFAPLYIRRMANPVDGASFANEAVRYYFYMAVVLTTICWFGADWMVWIAAPALDEPTHTLAVELTRIMVLGFALTGYVGVQSAIQQANTQFVPPLAVPVVNNIVVIAAILLAWYWGNVAIAVIGAVGAYLVQAVIQRLQTLRFYKTEFNFRVSGTVIKRLSLLSAPIVFASVLDQLNIVVGTALASGFGTGAVAQFNYASRLALFIAGVFSWLVSYVFFPTLAGNAAKNNDTANAALLTRALAIILVATAPAAAGALAMRQEVVALIYQRGSFGVEDVAATASLFGLLGIGVIFVSTRELLNRVFFSYQRTVAPMLVGIAAVLANLGFSLWLLQQIGLAGIALGNALAAVVFFLGQLALLWRWKPQLLQRRLLGYAGSIIFAATITYGITIGVVNMLAADLHVFARLTVGGLVLIGSYVPTLAMSLLLVGITPRTALAELRGDAIQNDGY